MGVRERAHIAVDIGGTFTDLVLEANGRRATAKILTTPERPEEGVMQGLALLLEKSGHAPGEIGLLVHGTTLATNAIIERKGARTALITTAGFRDSLEMAYEHRFAQYDIFMERPAPLVPRHLRFTVAERMDAAGGVRIPLDEAELASLVPALRRHGVESLAIGFLHSYRNAVHEERARTVLAALMPALAVTLSSEVCPEAREYERFSTASANAYVQPRMAAYLEGLRERLGAAGFSAPLLLVTSGGGLATIETAVRFPVRLVESGPAGGAILAADIARRAGLGRVLSFDMGGTTAKICLIDGAEPERVRQFEVDRRYRFLKGSGLPVRVPVVEMVEIGAGGGSIATVDALGRIAVGPESAGAAPGPACYGQGGGKPTVTDADLLLGRVAEAGFAGGRIALVRAEAEAAVKHDIAAPLGVPAAEAAFGIAEIVEENMANAARVHAAERGKELTGRTLIAFGGAAPLHAARLAEKLGIARVMIPRGAGVGSAIGFLRAPIAFEVVRSRFMRLSSFDAAAANALIADMAAEAVAAVRLGAPEAEIAERRSAEMRYAGQGHEIVVGLPLRDFDPKDAAFLRSAFEAEYERLFGRIIPGLDIEIMTWTLAASAPAPAAPEVAAPAADEAAPKGGCTGRRPLYDGQLGAFRDAPVYPRSALGVDASLAGPAVIVEAETTTVVTAGFTARLDASGAILLERRTEA